MIQDILKEIAQTQQVDLNARQRFKGPASRALARRRSISSSLIQKRGR